MVVQGYNYMSGTRTANYDESITTPVYGIVFTSWEHVSVYANRIEGLAQGPVSPLVAGTRRVIGGVDWDVPGLQGVALNGRMLRTGGQYADAANNLSLPAWNRFDIGARYTFTLGATVENVANEKYWESAQGGFLSQGDPRVAKLSATVDFKASCPASRLMEAENDKDRHQ